MQKLIFSDGASINVQYDVDLLGSNTGNLTVMNINGLDSSEEGLFKGFKKLPSSLSAFKAFATTNGLKLEQTDQDHSVVLVALPTTTTTTTGG